MAPTRRRSDSATTPAGSRSSRSTRRTTRSPSRRTAELWVERTPPDFTFDIKAHALMTGQPTETKRLPKGPSDGAARGTRREAEDLRQGPAGRAARQRLGLVHRWPRALEGRRAAGLDPPPVPALVLHQLGEPGCDRGSHGTASRRGPDGRGGVPQRELVQREEHRSDAALPWRSQDPAGGHRRPAGLQVEHPARDRGAITGPRDRPLPRPASRDLGGARASRRSNGSATCTTTTS